jgi:SAM-dependent methyltransferase
MATTGALRIDPGNAQQLRAWDGDEGAYWAANADRYDRAVAAHHGPFLAAAAIGRDDRVLDVGCGTGQLTLDAATLAPAGAVLGADLSSAMLDVGRRRAAAAGLANVSFEQVDAQVHRFDPASFDVVVSRTGAMFFGDPVAAFRNLGRALRTGGRLTLLAWQPIMDNEWFVELSGALLAGRPRPALAPGAPGPFSLADPGHVRDLLEESGFRDVDITGSSAAMWFGHDAEDATGFVLGQLGWMLDGLDDAGRSRAVDDLRATTRAHETPDGVVFGSATWTIRARRH